MDLLQSRSHRRDFLRSTAGAALLAASGAPAAALARHDGPTADSLILLWMAGGLPHAETFDPKRYTPFRPGMRAAGLGSTSRSIPTSLPGVRIAETLPELAEVLHLGTLVRSYIPGDESMPRHAQATASFHHGASTESDAPTLGARIFRRFGTSQGPVHSRGLPRKPPMWVEIGQRFAPSTESDVVSLADPNEIIPGLGRTYRHDLDAYGSGSFAHGCVLAGRLVEDGSRFVSVSTGSAAFEGWDAHVDGYHHAAVMARAVDRPIARLVRDLERKGLLDRTLVVVASEFSRAPDLGDASGRITEPSQYGHHRHYSGAGSLLLFGGGTPRGRLIGRTADFAPFPVVADPFTTVDLHAVIGRMLGLAGNHVRSTLA